MAFIKMVNGKPEKLSQKDVEALQDMLIGSLQEHLRCIDANIGGCFKSHTDIFRTVFQGAQDRLSDAIKNEQCKEEDINVSDFIQNWYDNIFDQLFAKVEKEGKDFFYFMQTLTADYNAEKGAFWAGTQKAALLSGLEEVLSNTPKDDIEKYYDFYFGKHPQDSKKSYQDLVKLFSLVQKPMEGIQEIIDYNPNSDSVRVLEEGRHGNSTTLDKAHAQGPLVNLQSQHLRVKDKKGLYPHEKGKYAFSYGTALARSYSVDWINKLEKAKQGQTSNKISFSDLYRAVTELNANLLLNTPEAGKLRGFGIQAGDNLVGVGTFVVPSVLYDTLTTIADYMNQINQMKDPLVRKTNAIRLAAFTYQTLLSAHVFQDGNGRTCRLFADTILQTFGLPPHTPSEKEGSIAATIGSGKIDFEQGAKVFLGAVQKSSDVLVSQFEVTKETLGQWGAISEQIEKSRDQLLKSPDKTEPPFYNKIGECQKLAKTIYQKEQAKSPTEESQKQIRRLKVQYVNAVRLLSIHASYYKNYKEGQLKSLKAAEKRAEQRKYDEIKLKDTNDVLAAVQKMKRPPKKQINQADLGMSLFSIKTVKSGTELVNTSKREEISTDLRQNLMG